MSALAITPRRRATLAKRNACRELDQARFSVAVRALHHRREFIEREDGFRERVFGNGYEDWTTDDDVRQWFGGLRYVEDLRSGLEFCRLEYIRSMVRKGWLVEDALAKGTFAITAACAERFKLPRVMGCAFPPATGPFGSLRMGGTDAR